ncbi:MAG: ABC transporter permease [Clostridiales bacterium]|nr:ABC transporter permease [Clostridiales bacterium]
MKIKAIALNTFKEAIRDRILYLLFFFAAVSVIFSRVLAVLTVGDRVKIVKDVGLASISLFGVLMAVMIGTGLVYKEIDKKTIYTLISKPIRRFEFLLGKFFGLVLTLLIMTSLMSLIFLLTVFFHTFKIEAGLLLAVLFIFIELILITAVAILFSCFSTPILSSLFSLSFFLIGHFSWSLETLIQKTKSAPLKLFIQALYALLPDLENFNFKTEVVYGLTVLPKYYLFSALYGLAYTAFILTLAVLIFKRRDFV